MAWREICIMWEFLRRNISSENVGTYIRMAFKVGLSIVVALNAVIFAGKPNTNISVNKTSEASYYTVGFGKSEIMPEAGTENQFTLAGYNLNFFATGVLDPCYARAVWIDDNSGLGGVVLVSVDSIGISIEDVKEMRDSLKDFAKENNCRAINIMSTHNHEAIDTLGMWGDLKNLKSGRDENYMKIVFAGVKDAVKKAFDDRRDGDLYYGKVETQPKVVNEKYLIEQQDTRLPQVFEKDLIRIRFEPHDAQTNDIYIINYAAHAEALLSDNSLISSDIPGNMCNYIEETTGADSIYFQGAIGGLIILAYNYYRPLDGEVITSQEMKSEDFYISDLFENDTENINNGYPVLKWENEKTDENISSQKDVWDGKASSEPQAEENVYHIKSAAELNWFAKQVNSGNSFKGATISLECSIDLNQKLWQPIGGNGTNNYFAGTFSGNGHAVENILITTQNERVGFFGAAGNGALIKDFEIKNGIIQGGNNSGGIVGMNVSGKLTIENCKNGAIIKTKGTNIGGIVGYMAQQGSSVNLCENNGNVMAATEYTYNCYGGIVGVVGETATVSKCENNAEISGANAYQGGIVGLLYGKAFECKNNGLIRNARNYMGGITGLVANNGQVKDSYNLGDIVAEKGRADVGGIASALNAANSFIENCYNIGMLVTSSVGTGQAGQICASYYNGSIKNSFGNSDTSSVNVCGFRRVGSNGEVSVYEQLNDIAKYLGDYACSIEDEKKLDVNISYVKKQVDIECHNFLLALASASKIINNSPYARIRKLALSFFTRSEMTYMKIGSINIAMVPGEIFPELVYGGYLPRYNANDNVNNPATLCEIAQDEDLIIFGLANDEIGYMPPPSDYYLHPDAPFVDVGFDNHGKRHYEETVSMSAETASIIAKCFRELVNTMNQEQK